MKKAEFFEKLKTGLKNLPARELQEVLAEYEDHFRNALAKGKTEEQICADLGSVEQIINGYKIDHLMQDQDAGKAKSIARAALILMAMAPFNFLIFMGPFFVSMVLLIVFWSLNVGMFFGAFGAAMFSLASFSVLFTPVLLVLCIGVMALAVFFALLLVPITHLAGSLTLKYLKWNLDFARGK